MDLCPFGRFLTLFWKDDANLPVVEIVLEPLRDGLRVWAIDRSVSTSKAKKTKVV